MPSLLSMSHLLWRRLLPGLLLLALGSCVEPYAPSIVSAPPSLLVVDGFLNARGATAIRLSRALAVDVKTGPPAETRATLFIEQQEGSQRFPLSETTPGTYVSAPLVLDAARHYRLAITTQAGRQYASDFVPVKLSPPLDAVSWQAEDNAVSVFVSTHDATDVSRYYRWEYEETWEIYPPYQATIEYYTVRPYVGGIRDIQVPFPTVCWGNSQSTRVLLSKTTALDQDVIAGFRVQTLAARNPALFGRYSMLVRQQTLTKEEYAYWELLRKNTENIGSLFDPLPSQVTGNVRSLDGAPDPVLGFVGVHSVTEKRLFIQHSELPGSWRLSSGYELCLPVDSIRSTSAQTIGDYFGRPDYLPIDYILSREGQIIGYTGKSRDCVDCRTRGSAVRPSFW